MIMDVALPELNGIEATRQMLAWLPETKVIVLFIYSAKAFAMGMMAAGASKFTKKTRISGITSSSKERQSRKE